MDTSPIGVVLAGGGGRRMGGAKATVELCGRPLIAYPLSALSQVLDEVFVLAKETTRLPSLPGTTVWIERDTRQHPLVGLLEALSLAGGRAVIVCALDLPLVTAGFIRTLTRSDHTPAIIASHEGETQPLLGRYAPRALEKLSAQSLDMPLRDAVMALEPRLLEVHAELLLNVNTPADLELAAAALSRRSRTWSASAE
jgi:molybdopterin-guanine dinucleotide biosynthesis protein A